MTPPTAADIEKLCEDWCAASDVPGGGMVMGASTERFRLLRNGVVFHQLSHTELCSAILGLSRVLLRPGLNTIIDQDHHALWSWCGELLLLRTASIFPHDQREIQQLCTAAIHAALANARKPPASRQEWEEQNRIASLQPHHAQSLIREAGIVLAYISFPLLEAVLKRSCSGYVELDGQVTTAFSVLNKVGQPTPYAPTGQAKRKCSSLRDLLWLYANQVATAQHRAQLDKFCAHIRSLDSNQEPFDLIYTWRNQSLHGSASFATIGGTVLNLALLLSIFEIEQDFETRRAKAVDQCRWEAQLPSRTPWSFYPPY